MFRRLLVAVVLALVLAACGGTEGDPEVGVDVGADDVTDTPQTPLAVSLPAVGAGAALQVGAAQDRPRVVNLWATWCPPCRAELPAFDEVAAAGEGVVEVVGVNIGEEPEDAKGLIAELGLTFPQYLDIDSDLMLELEVLQMPTTAFFRADGSLAETHAGALDADELIGLIDEHLGVQVSSEG